jgi:tRNA(adenine34) deaminase
MVCLGNYGMKSTKGVTLYSTLEPCAMCAGAIIQTGIKKVVYGEIDVLHGAHKTALKVLNKVIGSIRHSVLRQECREILLRFFEKELGRKSLRWFDIQLPKL